MATTDATPKNASAIEHAAVVEKTAYTIYGEVYRYLECERCGDQWTRDTPGDGCDCR
jgi:hypothetical protein